MSLLVAVHIDFSNNRAPVRRFFSIASEHVSFTPTLDEAAWPNECSSAFRRDSSCRPAASRPERLWGAEVTKMEELQSRHGILLNFSAYPATSNFGSFEQFVVKIISDAQAQKLSALAIFVQGAIFEHQTRWSSARSVGVRSGWNREPPPRWAEAFCRGVFVPVIKQMRRTPMCRMSELILDSTKKTL